MTYGLRLGSFAIPNRCHLEFTGHTVHLLSKRRQTDGRAEMGQLMLLESR